MLDKDRAMVLACVCAVQYKTSKDLASSGIFCASRFHKHLL